MGAIVLGTGVTVFCIAITLGGLELVRKRVRPEVLKGDHEVAAALVAVLGTLYAIVLGLVVVDALSHREQAQSMESTEANALATVMHLCRPLPPEKRRPIMQAELDYTNCVLEREWATLATGTAPDPKTVSAFGDLWERVAMMEPATNKETNLHASLLAAMTQFSDARRYRIVTCTRGLPSLLWLILIAGGVSTLSFTYFFAAEQKIAQAVMTGIVTFMLCLNVLLVYFYEQPYSGDFAIEPNGLKHVQWVLMKAPILQQRPGAAKSQDKPEKPPGGALKPEDQM